MGVEELGRRMFMGSLTVSLVPQNCCSDVQQPQVNGWKGPLKAI